MMLPNFIIIGVPRAGTTYLANCLGQHPDIYLPMLGYTGDIHFFDASTKISLSDNYKKGIQWYEAIFAGRTREKAVGEKTAHYFSDPIAPKLIHDHLSDVKMICVLRNPIDRAYSDFWYHRGEFPVKSDFTAICKKGHQRLKIVEVGLYFEHLKNYLKYFDKEQLHFTILDDINNNPLVEIKKIYEFLDVIPDFVPEKYDKKVNMARKKGKFAYLSKFLGGYVKENHPAMFMFFRKFRAIKALETRLQKNAAPTHETAASQYPPMPVEAGRYLSDVYYESNSKMSEFLGIDLISLWHKHENTNER